MNKKTKFIINIISIIIIIIVLGAVAYLNVTKETYKYKLELDNIIFLSDENIVEKIQYLKDANSIAIIFDTTLNKNYSANNSILFTQLFSYNQKTVPFYILSENEKCVGHDGNRHTFSKTTNVCLTELNNFNYPKIMMGEIKENKKLTVIIKNNFYYIIPTALDKAYSENEKFLRFVYPNFDDIAKSIEDFIGTVTDKVDSKQMIPKT